MKKLFVLLLVSLVLIPGVFGALDDNLVTHWKFDETAGIVVPDSHSYFDGIAYGITDDHWHSGYDCIKDGCLYLDPGDSSYINFGNHAEFLPGGPSAFEFTIIFWIKPTVVGGITQGLWDKSNFPNANNEGFFTLIRDDGTFDMEGCSSDVCSAANTASTIGINEWVMVTMVVKRNGNDQIYFNTTLKYDGPGITLAEITSEPAIFGLSGAGYFYTGYVDELRLYDKALTSAEVQEVFMASQCIIDNDGDGYYQSQELCGTPDCDDTDASAYPGAPEICDNGIDNDCDELIGCDDSDCGVFCLTQRVDALESQICVDCDSRLTVVEQLTQAIETQLESVKQWLFFWTYEQDDLCTAISNECIEPECSSDANCKNNEQCVNGECVKTTGKP